MIRNASNEQWTPVIASAAPATQYDVEDIPIDVPAGGEAQEAIPEGIYVGMLVRLKTVDKPEWKLKGEEGEDRQQYEWVFEITEGKYTGTRLNDYTNRTFHEKATAHKHAAALLGVEHLDPRVHTSTGILGGIGCAASVLRAGLVVGLFFSMGGVGALCASSLPNTTLTLLNPTLREFSELCGNFP